MAVLIILAGIVGLPILVGTLLAGYKSPEQKRREAEWEQAKLKCSPSSPLPPYPPDKPTPQWFRILGGVFVVGFCVITIWSLVSNAGHDVGARIQLLCLLGCAIPLWAGRNN